jgi:uroporphyrinogen III methyltransferase/synthase
LDTLLSTADCPIFAPYFNLFQSLPMKNDSNSPIPDSNVGKTLAGQTVLITRPADQTLSLAEELKVLGANILIQPAIEIRPPADWSAVDSAIGRLEEFTWIVFVSVNGVHFFLDRCQQLGVDLARQSHLSHLSIAAGGVKTREALQSRGVDVDLVPQPYDSPSMAVALLEIANKTVEAAAERNDQAGKLNLLMLRTNRGSPVIAQALQNANVPFEQVAAYENADVATAHPNVIRKMQAGEIDWVTVTSSAIARSLVGLFGEALKKTKLVSISPTTSDVLRELGSPPSAEARVFEMSGVVAAMLERQKR